MVKKTSELVSGNKYFVKSGFRKRTIFSILDKIPIRRNRVYDIKAKIYFYPLDEQLDIARSQTSKELAKQIFLISIFTPFDHGLKIIKDLLMFDIPKRILQNVTYNIGNTLTKYHQTEIPSDENIELSASESSAVEVQYFLTDGGQTPN